MYDQYQQWLAQMYTFVTAVSLEICGMQADS